jgi:hypothetical protein
MKRLNLPLLLLIALLCTKAVGAQTTTYAPDTVTRSTLSTMFTLQGVLRSAAETVNGACDLRFALFSVESGGSALGELLFRPALAVVDGLFTTQLDFGTQFTGAERWLETAVRCPTGSGNYVILTPRQRVTAVPYALHAESVTNVTGAAGDFTAQGILRSARGRLDDNSVGALELVNNFSQNKWYLAADRATDQLTLGFIDTTSTWHHAVTFEQTGNLIVVGNLYVNRRFTSDVTTTGVLRSTRGNVQDSSTGTLELENGITNNKWHLTTGREQDSLEFWFIENQTNPVPGLKLERSGNLLLEGDSLIFADTAQPAGILWGVTDAAIGRADKVGAWSTDAQTGDLVLRAEEGKRIILGRGTKSPDHPAALTVQPSGVVAIPQLQGSGYIEANLQTPGELASNQITRFSQGDLLCWAEATAQLARCDQPASPLVVAVADANGKPLILGVEPVKVQGPVQAGDLLVASSTPGVAVAWSQVSQTAPPPGVVIAKALASFTGETGLIKAMILAR